jgi:hypothetical protein
MLLVVRRNKKASKLQKNGVTYSDSPDTPKDELSVAQGVAIDKPALMLLHQDGTAEGWNGSNFWWPILLSPKNAKRTIFAMPEATGTIKHSQPKSNITVSGNTMQV